MARYALVIGIGQNRSPLPSLSKTVGDAGAIAQALQEWGDFRVDCLTQPEQLTQTALTEAIKQFINQKAKTAEVALIYYTGHAVPVVDAFAEETEVFLAPVDCAVVQQKTVCTAQQNGISLKSLSALLAKAELKNLVMLLDCCHGGALVEPEALDRTFAGFKSKNYWLLTACRSFEVARAKKSEAHSLFSGAVLRGLAIDQADDRGEITANKLFGFVTEALRKERQEPQQLSVGGSVVVARHRAPAKAAEVDGSIEPYQGLNAFTPKTKQFFFGRDGEVVGLLRKLQESSFVPVIGPSGIGKSSIVRAGLVPRLLEQGWQILGPIKPGPDPIGELNRSFRDVFPERRLAWVYEQIEAGDLGAVVAELPGASRFLLVVDQFEEVFTVCINPEKRQRFITQLVGTNRVRPPGVDSPHPPGVDSQPDSRLAIVTTMRSDFINNWLATGQPTQVMQNQTVMVGPLQGLGLRDAIVKPAELLGYQFGEGLVELILADVESEPNSLPLLEFALSELWGKRDAERRLLTAAAYREMGRLQGALNTRAEAVYADLRDGEQDWARRVCLALVRVGVGETDTRQRQPREKLLALAADDREREMVADVIGALSGQEGRLLATDEGIVDLAHEALMGGWERFVEWRQADRDQRRLVQRVEDAREEWGEKGQQNDYLLPKGLLGELRELAPTVRDELLGTAERRDFFRLSDEQDQESATALKRALVNANLREDCIKILALPPAKIFDKTLMAIATVGESLDHFQEAITPVQDALNQAWRKIREQLKQLEGHTGAVTCVAFSPQGDRIVSSSDDDTLRLWDLEGRTIGEPFQGHSAWVTAVAFSPRGDRIVSGSHDTLRLWDLEGRTIGELFQGHSSWVTAVAFSPQGDQIISGSDDDTLRLWDLEGRAIGEPFQGHSASVMSVAFSPQGDRIVSGSGDNSLRLWDVEGKTIGEPFQGHSSWVTAVAFSPQGDRIVSGSHDNSLRLWDLEGRTIGEPFQGHSASVWAVAFSPQGDQIISGSHDNTLRLWNLEGRTIGEPLQGHSAWVTAVAFSPQGDRIVSSSADGTLRLWRGGTWRDWLHDCCTEFMFHIHLVSPETDFARQACEVCKTHAWNREETARFLRAQAHILARQGKPEESAAKLAEAQHLDPEPNR